MHQTGYAHHLVLVIYLLLSSWLWLIAHVVVVLMWWRDYKVDRAAVDFIRKTFLPIPVRTALAAAGKALEDHKNDGVPMNPTPINFMFVCPVAKGLKCDCGETP